ncbi:MAG: FecR domain-containing protein [Candidatus Abyssubacteria bacterium]|nr:FecR domain-containing protein [Candidatus Abyssubacteria bacterium]
MKETCEERISRIHMLVEGELSTQEAKELNEHLLECEQCSNKSREFSEMKSLIEDTLAEKTTIPDLTDTVVRRAEQTGLRLKSRNIFAGFLKKALIGVTACLVILVASAYLFVHFYFGKTFSHELNEVIIRCSNGMEISGAGREWRSLRAGDRLERATSIRTPAGTRSFMSFDGIRLLAEGEAEFGSRGRRAFSLEKGAMVIESVEKKKPVRVLLGNATIRANGGVFRIARREDGFSVGVASGTVDVAMPDGKTHKLIENQIAYLGDEQADLKVTYGKVHDPFAQRRVLAIDRVRQRFARMISKYFPDYKMTKRALKYYRGMEIVDSLDRPEGLYQFASYTPTSTLRLAQAQSGAFGEYYDDLFAPSNRSIAIGRQKVVPLDPGRGATFPRWSHDGSMIAFIETSPGSLVGQAKVVRLDDLDNPWDISQDYAYKVRAMFPPTWAPDNRHVLFQVETGQTWDEHGPTANFQIKIAPIDPSEGPLRDFDSPFYDIPLPLPVPVGKNISPSIAKLPWGDAIVFSNWGNLTYIPVEENGQAVPTAPGLFITNFDPRECFVMGGGFSPSGGMMDFTAVKDFDFDHMNSYILYDAEDILDGFASAPRSLDDPRIRPAAPTKNMQFTGGFSFDESLVFVHEDVNHAFDIRYPTNIFPCDFDLLYASALRGESGPPTQIHQPGNQMFLEPSPEGNRISYCNYTDTEFELRVVSFDIEADMDMDLGGVLIDNSGTSLIVPPGALEENFKVKISTPFSIEDEAEISVGESTFFAMRMIDAQGLESPQFAEPLTLTIRYTDDEVAGLNEGMLEVYYYDENDPDHPVWVPLGGTVDPVNNEITVEIQHFSKFSIGGKAPEGSPATTRKPFRPEQKSIGNRPGGSRRAIETARNRTEGQSPHPRTDTSTIIVEEGIGFDDITFGNPQMDMEFIKSRLGQPVRENENQLDYRFPYGMDFWLSGPGGPLREIRLNPGFKGSLSYEISLSSSMGDVFETYGKPVAEETVENLSGHYGNRTLYKKADASKIFYNEYGLLFWFRDDRINQIVVFKKQVESSDYQYQQASEEDTSTIIVEEGVGFGGIVVGTTESNMEFIRSTLGEPEEETEERIIYKKRYGIDFWMPAREGPLQEIRLNRGFGGKLSSGISLSSSMGDVFETYGKPVAEETVSEFRIFKKNRTLYIKGKSSIIYYRERGVLFWFAEDQISQIVVFEPRHAASVEDISRAWANWISRMISEFW